MSAEQLGRRLERLADTLSAQDFLQGAGIGNEISFHVFAYPPEYEAIVADYLPRLVSQLEHRGVNVLLFNLYELIIEELTDRDLLEKSFELEGQKGTKKLEAALRKFVHPDNLIARMKPRLDGPHDLVLLTGVGAAYPLIRSHTILNNLHPVIARVPLVLFFPGSYTGNELRLFDRLKDDNYYRAFPLLQEAVISR